ncbi:hypothetical protein NB520_08935 [Vibrio antiquarius]|uniref:hypothetical protein n=1 Tax=Vibrio antiquarius (strain Ex25) TaxID=150340 RepID=UPI001A264EC7|nr:hypothetical protein [Vibrio antiquarius]EHI9301589.1 hypothetical protein [Vibrio vulnificus]HAV1371949.1 hypothetical protein [Vibrio parahaemolyticus]MCR9628000.1 hypothetical protein [Vibrio antiquarius]MCR9631638.1 hypothetical protein [Vibrio antiquarius]HAS6397035.1 hypothetical protein [Vibrio vulnificus]
MAVQSSSVQYAYALGEDGILTHISKAQRAHSYTCFGCGSRLNPVLGEINAKHFRHIGESCSLETYLHKTAKEVFFYLYQQALNSHKPIALELERNVSCSSSRLGLLRNKTNQCCSRTVPARYDLTKFFDQVELEKRDEITGLQPDVMLSDSSSTRRCYIEICVTHPCTQDKIDMGIPIVEFYIQSVYDIDMLFSNSYSIADERVTAFNWSPPSIIESTCSNICSVGKTEMSVWCLNDSGRLNETIIPLANVDLAISSEINTWPRELGLVEQENNLKNFLRHVDPKMLHPNCIMCVQGSSWNNGHLRCHSKAKYVPYTEALQCAAFKARK